MYGSYPGLVPVAGLNVLDDVYTAVQGRTLYAVLVKGSDGDGAWRGMVTIFESIHPRPYKNQSPVYGRLIYSVIYMSHRLLTRENPTPHVTPPPVLRS